MRTLGLVIMGLAVAGVSVAFAAPDLIVSSISGAGSSPTYVTISNIGTNVVPVASNDVLKVWLNSPVPVAVGTVSPYLRKIGRVTAGASKTFKFTGLPWPSNGVFRAFADADNGITESSEINNQATAAY